MSCDLGMGLPFDFFLSLFFFLVNVCMGISKSSNLAGHIDKNDHIGRVPGT